MAEAFIEVPGATAFVRAKNGAYSLRQVWRRGGDLFLTNGSSFVRVEGNNTTSSPFINIVELDLNGAQTKVVGWNRPVMA